MNYANIYKADISNGKSFRVSLFCTGCARGCPGCFNKAAQDPAFGRIFDDSAKEKIFKELEHEWCKGLSLLGGEPLSKLSDNRSVIIGFCKEVKSKYSDKDIWLWSGYTFEEIAADKSMSGILKYVDVLVDGPFIESLKDLSIPFRGSSNQRILDIAEYRKSGKVVSYTV